MKRRNNGIRKLISMMEYCSENMWCAGWLTECEYYLWHYLQTGEGKFYEGERDELRCLSEKIDGWAIWDEKKGHPVYIKREDWIPLYLKWRDDRNERRKRD